MVIFRKKFGSSVLAGVLIMGGLGQETFANNEGPEQKRSQKNDEISPLTKNKNSI
jgi:hypothetical protein